MFKAFEQFQIDSAKQVCDGNERLLDDLREAKTETASIAANRLVLTQVAVRSQRMLPSFDAPAFKAQMDRVAAVAELVQQLTTVFNTCVHLWKVSKKSETFDEDASCNLS